MLYLVYFIDIYFICIVLLTAYCYRAAVLSVNSLQFNCYMYIFNLQSSRCMALCYIQILFEQSKSKWQRFGGVIPQHIFCSYSIKSESKFCDWFNLLFKRLCTRLCIYHFKDLATYLGSGKYHRWWTIFINWMLDSWFCGMFFSCYFSIKYTIAIMEYIYSLIVHYSLYVSKIWDCVAYSYSPPSSSPWLLLFHP